MAKAKKQIRVIYKRVGFDPVEVTIDNELDTMQRMVGGYIETLTLPGINTVLLFDEDGKLDDRAKNFDLPWNNYIAGAAVFAGIDGEDFADCPISEAELREIWPALWEEDARC